MTELKQYENGYSPSALQRKYSLSYEQGYELAQDFKRLQEQLADANKTIDYYDKKDFHYMLADGTVMGAEPAHKYKVKWGVK